jgi:crotonobetainyl-CoA:carnitine CoA-transferase CaiB-like acyl-CoA transferase
MDIPSGIVQDVTELLENPQLQHRNMVVDIEHPALGKVKTFNLPIKYFSTSLGISKDENPADAELGEHSQEVLEKYLGLNETEINELRTQKIIWA